MCGVAGYCLGSGYKAAPPDMSEVVKVIRHRGPDGNGVFLSNNSDVGLAHVRLSIIDLSATGAQPMQSQDSRFTLSYNGEIYNFRDLRASLELDGHSFVGFSDTEVLLRLLQIEGLSVLSRLNGMFSFALHDASEGEVTLVRDAHGVKPMYFCETECAVFFSSEVRGLLAMGVKAQHPSGEALGMYLSYLWNPGMTTPAKNIQKLRPGEAITIKSGRIVRRWIWFNPPITAPQIVSKTDAELITKTTEVLRNAVHRQMVADVPVGAFLSGGLDSSAVVALAREISPDITCYTIETTSGPEEGIVDDLPYARTVAEHLGVPLEIVKVDADRMARDLERMVWQLEEPLADPACLNVLYISQLAREQGIKVLLSGSGGDDLFTGYRRHQAVALDSRLQIIPAPVRSAAAKLGLCLNTSKPSIRRVAKYLDGFGSLGSDRLVNYFVWTKREDVLRLFAKEVREQASGWNFSKPLSDYLETCSADIDPINAVLSLEQRFFLAEHNLVYTDKMSMAASVEVRVPFLDLDLSTFASTLPVSIKQRGRVGKWVLKKVMEPYLPRHVIYRSKAGFGAPLRRWLQGDLKEFMYDLLSADSLKRRGIFDVQAVSALIAQNEAGHKDASYTIFSLMCIEIWCRAFVDDSYNNALSELYGQA